MSLLATRLQNWRIADPRFSKNTLRASRYGALDLFVSQTEAPDSIITPELRAKALGSMGNTVQIPVFDKDTVTVATSRTCVVADNESTSALYTISFSTLSVGFTIVPSLYANNEIGYEADFNRKMAKITNALANKLDQLAVAALEANKTQKFNDTLIYTPAGNAIPADWNQREDILEDVATMMMANGYDGQVHIVGNGGIDALVRKLAQHGFYNDVNRQLEYADKVFHFTNNITNAEGKYGTLYAVEEGNVGVVTRLDRESARQAQTKIGHEWLQVDLGLGMPVGLHHYQAVGDQSTIAGDASADLTCAVKDFYGFSLDVAFIVAYNNDLEGTPNPIIKATIDKGTNYATPVTVVGTVSTKAEA